MKQSLSREEMLQLWQNIHMAEPLRLDCVVVRRDGTDLTALMEAEMRAWYLGLLDAGAEEMVCPQDISDAAIVTRRGGLTLVEVPAAVRRILSVEFEGWGGALRPTASEEEVRRAAANPYCYRPRAAMVSRNRLMVSEGAGKLLSLTAVVDPGAERYIFDERAMETLIGENRHDF